jgi:hypothetical protein
MRGSDLKEKVLRAQRGLLLRRLQVVLGPQPAAVVGLLAGDAVAVERLRGGGQLSL